MYASKCLVSQVSRLSKAWKDDVHSTVSFKKGDIQVYASRGSEHCICNKKYSSSLIKMFKVDLILIIYFILINLLYNFPCNNIQIINEMYYVLNFST